MPTFEKAVEARDLDAVEAMLADDVVFHSPVAFRPYPTPLFDSDGGFTGAINMLVDVSDEQVDALNRQAERCRRLAGATYDREVSDMLDKMAAGYERNAAELSKPRAD